MTERVKFSRAGIVLSSADLRHFADVPPEILFLAPGLVMTEGDAQARVACPVFSLNRFSSEGAITDASREITPVLMQFIAAIEDCPTEASSSQNDVYQYHLRPQYYFVRALEVALHATGAETLEIATRPYAWYWSPERPEQNRLHEPERINALLAARLARRLNLRVTLLTGQGLLGGIPELLVCATVRFVAFRGYRFLQLLRKVRAASRDAASHTTLARWRRADAAPIGILVRTFAEVVAARELVRILKPAGIPYLFIHDEMLSSRTTMAGLVADRAEYVSIGAMRGMAGLLAAYVRARRHFNWRMPQGGGRAALEVITGYRRLWRTVAARLIDFTVDQHHFAAELRTIARETRMRAMVSFAYLDQWGQVIRASCMELGIPTICIQCAAQDPEMYPALRWADFYCVESLGLKNCLMSFGCPAEGLAATGLPHLTEDTSQALPNARALEARRAIGVLTQPIYGRYFEQIIEVVGRVCADLGYDLLIKYHPRQRGDEFDEAIGKVEQKVKVRQFRLETLDDYLNQTTVCVSVVSATILKCIGRGIPIFSLLPIEERHLNLPYVREDITGAAATPHELDDQLRNALGAFGEYYEGYTARRQKYLIRHAQYEPTQDVGGNILTVIRGAIEWRVR
jgi:hypothetical protein